MAIDDSPASAEATHVVAQVASALKAMVTVLHVYPRDVSTDQGAGLAAAAQSLVERSVDIVRGSDAKANPAIRSANSDDVADVILGLARTIPADLIVVGSRGRRSLAELLLGSVSHEVVAGAPCPVLVIRSAHGLPARPVRKILLAIEGTADVDALFAATADLALALGAEVEVAHFALPDEGEIEKDLHHARKSHGEQALDEISERLRAAGVNVNVVGLTGIGPIAHELARQAEAEDADLIVVGSPKLTGVIDQLVGSVADGVIHRTRRPVLLANAIPAHST